VVPQEVHIHRGVLLHKAVLREVLHHKVVLRGVLHHRVVHVHHWVVCEWVH
jgi:hypothetical protein